MTRAIRPIVWVCILLVVACSSSLPPETTVPPAPPVEPAARRNLSTFALIPFPQSVVPGTGAFPLGAETTIRLADSADAELIRLGEYAAELVGNQIAARIGISYGPAPPQDMAIHLRLEHGGPTRYYEGYRIEVTANTIDISATDYAGLFYGLQTLRQLLQLPAVGTGSARAIPAVVIQDQPRFVYRGMHLDVGRHFFPVSFIKHYIDLMSMYKMNTFHWHLTEDQGWRIEIKRYPKLTEIGAYRNETILEKNFEPYVGDGVPYGGFYTQDEIREVVEHARRRYVRVIPEIEMPGHSTAALAAYPEFACTDGPFEVATTWGVHPDIFCPTDATFGFLEDVLGEVMALFPGRYIHIGGDEAPKTRWENSEVAQEIIRREDLADEHELQSHFVKRIETFLSANGRTLIGWDEILEGGLAPEATVMSWRGMDGGVTAARQGHDVIMTPTSHVYFDYYQGDPEHEPLAIGGYTPLEKVYAFEPVPEELSAPEAARVLGAQGNVWTEYMKTSKHVQYMVFPRMLALAEVVWSPAHARDWTSFRKRLPTLLAQLGKLGVNYREPW